MLKLSKKWDIALKAVSYCADKSGEKLQLSRIAQDIWVSELSLRQIIPDLAKSGILVAQQGRGGGIMFQKNPTLVSVYDVLFSVGENLGITDCTEGIFCPQEGSCYTTHILKNLQRGFISLLKLQTLDKVIKK